MKVEPLETVLIRRTQTDEAALLNFLADAIEQVVNIGTHFINGKRTEAAQLLKKRR